MVSWDGYSFFIGKTWLITIPISSTCEDGGLTINDPSLVAGTQCSRNSDISPG